MYRHVDNMGNWTSQDIGVLLDDLCWDSIPPLRVGVGEVPDDVLDVLPRHLVELVPLDLSTFKQLAKPTVDENMMMVDQYLKDLQKHERRLKENFGSTSEGRMD